jgi:hypothetical protein
VDTVDTVLKVVRALYDYAPANETEIILKEGEMVKVYQMADEWWLENEIFYSILGLVNV